MASTTIFIGSGDGYATYDETSTTFTTGVNAATGSSVTNANATILATSFWSDGTSRAQIHRAFLPVDTSPLGAGATVTAAVMKLFVFTIFNGDADANGHVGVYDASQASTSTLVVADYDQVADTAFSNTIDFGDLTDDAYNDFTLTAGGRSNIDVTGFSKFSSREGHDVADDEPTTDLDNGMAIRGSEQTGTDEDPKIDITFTPAVSFVPSVMMF